MDKQKEHLWVDPK